MGPGDPATALLYCYSAVNTILPPYEYLDRDWNKYHAWRSEFFEKLSKEAKKKLYDEERATGIPMGPADCMVKKTRSYTPYDIVVYAMFPQTWGDTSLGFGGIAGQAVTTAYTTILEVDNTMLVFFGGRFAYSVKRPNQSFHEDVAKRVMRPVRSSYRYEIHE